MRNGRPSLASTPKRYSSIVSGAIVAADSTTNGPFALADSWWIVRAASSLPVPAAPAISTRALVGATRSSCWRSWFTTVDLPTIFCVSPARTFSSLTSRRSWEVSSARCATRISRSALKGFSMKS
jgi:hypothetical protein